jgi:L-amino acid N-acyltransferase YncA
MNEINQVRGAEATDADAIAAIYAPHVTEGVASFEAIAPDAAEMRARISETTRTHPWLVCERDGEVIGYAYAGPHSARAAYVWSVNVTVYIARQHQRGGIGRTLYTALFEQLRRQGFYNAYAGITVPNPGSVGLHEAMGFKRVGFYPAVGYKFGAWRDVGWWELPLQEKPLGAPPPPLLPHEVPPI